MKVGMKERKRERDERKKEGKEIKKERGKGSKGGWDSRWG